MATTSFQRTSAQPPAGRFWVRRGFAAAADLLFPPRCTFCLSECLPGNARPLFCEACDQRLTAGGQSRCPRCGMSCSQADLPLGNCGYCRGLRLHFSEVRTIGSYQDVLREAVLKIKHAVHEPLAVALGKRLAECIRSQPLAQQPDVVVPVPMHWFRRLSRHTNTAQTLARTVAAALRLPLGSGWLVCRRFLQRQASLTPPQRKLNVRGAFRASYWARLAGRRVLLVDDVMTTGATAQEASRTLGAAGAAEVCVAIVARSSPDF